MKKARLSPAYFMGALVSGHLTEDKIRVLLPRYVKLAEKKGRDRTEVLEGTAWLTGYTPEQIQAALATDVTYGDFFRQAPALNPDRTKITGTVCGVRVELVEEPLMREMRYLDKLVDELAKGKPMNQIIRN